MSSPYTIIGSDGREYSGSLEELRQWAQEGRLGPATLVWNDVDERWVEAAGRHELVWDLPRSAVPPPPPSLPVLAVAGFVPRLLACLADAMVILFLVKLVLLPWQDPLQDLLRQVQAQLEPAGGSPPDLGVLIRFQLIFAGIYTGVTLAYLVVFHGCWGATPGKRLMGLTVVTLDGGPLGYLGALRRGLAGILSVLTFGLGYLLILTPQRRALHDLIAGTQVVLVTRD
jgi:uncharacterized RDD family membrane protein YckC